MTKSTITRERARQIFLGNGPEPSASEERELARMALAAMDSESGCLPLDYLQGHKDGLEWASQLAEANHPETGDWLYDDPIELAKAIRKGPDMPPVQPAPVVPDDVLKALQKVARIRLDMDGFDGDRRGIADCLCDAEEALIEVVNRRAAMFNHPEQHLDMVDHSGDVNEKGGDGNSQVIPDGWTCNDKANAALMMLDRIETVDPVDDDRIDGIKRIVRELAAAPHDTPALNSVQSVVTVPGKWIPVSERMPEDRTQVILWDAEIGEVTSGHYSHKTQTFYHCGDAIENEITHWMLPPSAPQGVKP
ncbi:DUF551 domain-containing protein [Klebsiella quasipneumoniae subsp. similipneumoniae]|nr:DUF551 domain-containing protein [Klebsiella quasipneumoniae]MCS4378083.1 DUF551 domain-containing protein [Klebsiella quasipneumoniae subsp. similipneumoniae]MCS4418498.1 DUF551 domain-containing protein [Klebsiella quasipneumoniae subsp. similipneumoniae]